MITEQMREEFEAAVKATAAHNIMLDFRLNTDGTYWNSHMRSAWWAWQASRAALEIELPAIEAWENDGRLDRERDDQADCAMGLIPLADARSAIEAAGAKAKID